MQVLSTAGILRTSTSGTPGAQGAEITGEQGEGAPNLAATEGLPGLVHILKPEIFVGKI
jgi:hypothetical protein